MQRPADRFSFEVVGSTPPGFPSPRIAQAAHHAGCVGAVLLENSKFEEAASVVETLTASGIDFTVSIGGLQGAMACLMERAVGFGLKQVILSEPLRAELREEVASLKRWGIRALVQVTSVDEAGFAQECDADGLIVKGNESGGRVGEETTFILLQRVLAKASVPVLARGGIGLRTAAACLAAGAAGVVLEWQLALCEESEIPEPVRARIARMDGSETAILGQGSNRAYRVYARPGESAYWELKGLEEKLPLHSANDVAALESWQEAVETQASEKRLLLVGQDASLAAPLAESYRTVGAICQAVKQEAIRQVRVAARLDVLRSGGPLAVSHGTRYPIVQGPMTRVSDRAEFALAVAAGGGLPFLALALMRPSEVGALLEESKRKLGTHAWGIGILGFVPQELREAQLAEAMKYAPPFAIIAGGRPDQAKRLEQAGTGTYLHVPSPELLRNFLENGARRVIFEGRECGGHVGPRTSFVLWELMIRVILDHLAGAGAGRPEDYHVLFAGGIHDARSGAMVSAMATPLSERGVQVGVLLGTGYLFTHEAVATGAITEGFQQEAIVCDQTILLESGVGHATRCARTAFGEYFAEQKRLLVEDGRSKDEIREALERLNLGRLRIAAKGIARGDPQPDGTPTYRQVEQEEQHREGMYMIGQVAALRDSVCSIEDLHADVSRAGEALRKRLQAAAAVSRPSDIAIIGMSCILPKAKNVTSYWRNILGKVNAIQEIPKERWDVDLYFDGDRRAPDRIYSRWGGFIDSVVFDPVRYGMPPNSVPSIEPLQLLTLEIVREALLDAGLLDRRFNRERTSVIIGAGGGVGDVGLGYGFRSLIPHFLSLAGGTRADADHLIERVGDRLPQWTEDSFPGLLLNVAAGRVANRFDLGGANYVVDAACATSLAALRLAANELETGSSDVAIVAGADTMMSPFGYLCFSKTQALSPTGQCRTFDESADGIVISEGIAVAVLKRLEDAIEHGDRIYAVLRGVGASSDGKDKGLTAPRPIGQIRALDRAYAKAAVPPSTVGLVEAHGTGTVVGDRTEVESLTTFFESAGAGLQTCALGSVKSMIGHTKCTAGFAGVIKAALALHCKVLPPTIGITKPNSKANFSKSPMYLNTEARPWFKRLDEVPRRAGVSAFGFGGTNFHAVLEEYESPGGAAFEGAPLPEWPAELFLWKAQSAEAVLQAIDLLATQLKQGAKPRLTDLAAAVYWQNGRPSGSHCLAVVATSLEDLAAKLESTRKAVQAGRIVRDPRGVYYSPEAAASPGKIAFVFPGQGSQRVNALIDLALAFPRFRAVFEQADHSLGDRLGKALSSLLFPPPAFTEEEKNANEMALRQTQVAQPALGAAGMAMHGLLGNLGIHPDLAGGHSYGEFVALCAGGAISFTDLIRVSEARGRYIVEAAQGEPGTMAAVDAGEAVVMPAIERVAGVSLANLNAPSQTVISGTQAGVAEALKRLSEKGVPGRPIPVACAFHSDLVAGAQEPLRRALDQCAWRPLRIPVFSNTTAAAYPGDPEQIRTRLTEHLLQPVRFCEEVLAMHEAGARIFIEAGPGKVLTGLIERILGDRPFLAVAMDQLGQHGLVQLLRALAQLATAGVPFFAWRLFEGRVGQNLHVDRLVAETQPASPPQTAWIIRAAGSIPAYAAKKESNGPAPASQPSAPPLAHKGAASAPLIVAAGDGSGHDGARAVSTARAKGVLFAAEAKTAAMPPSVGQTPASSNGGKAGNGSLELAMRSHHRLMSRFLESHKSIMLAYMADGSTATVPRRAESNPLRAAAQHSVEAAPGVAVATPVEAKADSTEPKAEIKEIPAPTEEVIIGRLVELVSQRTGYPPNMLDLDLDLEADLGIDSIKRVEIFSALQSAALLPAESLEGEIETLSKLKTLRAIAEWMVARAEQRPAEGGAAAPQPAASAQPSAEVLESLSAPMIREEPLHRMVVTVVKAPPAPAALLDAGLTLITDDGGGIALLLADALRNLGIASQVIGEEQSDLLNPAAVGELVQAIRRDQGAVKRLVHLIPLGGVPEIGEEEFQRRLDRELMSLFHLVRALEVDLRQGLGSVLAATRLGGSFAVGPDAKDFWPGSGATSGFVKTLGREWPEVACKTVDFEAKAEREQIVRALLSELACRDGLSEVGYQGGRRTTLAPTLAPLGEAGENLHLGRESVVLVTGGARGITAEVATELAERFQPRLVLVGRSPAPPAKESPELESLTSEKEFKAALFEKLREAGQKPAPAMVESEYKRIRREREIRSNILAMTRAGSMVEYHSVDVGEEAAFANLLDRVYGSCGRIDGVIHGAGVIEDKLIRDKLSESFVRVVKPKVAGALTLCRKLRPESLQFLIFFSSVSARYGNRGQCDYAAANEALNKLAVWLNARWPGRVASLNWGPWKSEGGMVTPELEKRFAQAGVQLVSPPAGRKAFVDELRCGGPGDSEVIWGGPTRQEQAKHPDPTSDADRVEKTYPLLGDRGRISKKTNGSFEVLLETDPDEHVYLLHHRLDGTPVMPMAMILEMAAEAATANWPEMHVTRIRDLQILSGIKYQNGSRRVLRVEASTIPARPNGRMLLDLTVRSEAGDKRPHYRAQIELRPELVEPPEGPGLELVQPRPLGLSVAQAYESWLFHGPLFAGITRVDALGANGVAGRLRSSSPQNFFKTAPSGAWLVDPAMLDSGMQLVLLWVRTYLDQTPLPVHVGCYHRFASRVPPEVRCEADVRGDPVNPTMRSDVRFFDEDGRIVAWLEDVQFTRSRALNRLSAARAAAGEGR